MFTFLPRAYRAQVEREYRKRLWTVAWSLIATLAVFGVGLSVPSFVAMHQKKEAATIAFKGSAVPAQETIELESRVRDVRAKTQLLEEALAKKHLSSVLEQVALRVAQPGISVTGIGLKRGGGVSLSGTALTRDSLVAFTKALGSDGQFKNVSLPVSSLAKSKDIPFSLQIGIQF